MMKEDIVGLLKFLKGEVEKHLKENPYNFLEEGDLQAFLYCKFSEFLDKRGTEKYFEDDEGEKPITVYIVHCEYPRHLLKENGDGLQCNRGRYDIAILRRPKKEERKYIGNSVVNYPVEVAFELKLIWNRRLSGVINNIKNDLVAFGWDTDKKEFQPNVRRLYPTMGVVFHVNLVKNKVKENKVKENLKKVLNKKDNYTGKTRLPEKIFIVYIEVDKYNKKINESIIYELKSSIFYSE